mgnify:CR=1 FL=1
MIQLLHSAHGTSRVKIKVKDEDLLSTIDLNKTQNIGEYSCMNVIGMNSVNP